MRPKQATEAFTLGKSKRKYVFFTDGSIRRELPKVKGKAAVKAHKRAKRR